MSISKLADANEIVLATKTIGSLQTGKPTLLRFANVDHGLTLEFGKRN